MPVYEYCCQKCEKRSEFSMKMSDPHPESCPHCQAENSLRKLMSRTAFQLKGGGWYHQAYDGKSNQKPEVADKGEKPASSEAAPDTGGAAAASSDKPAAKEGGAAKPAATEKTVPAKANKDPS